MFNKLTFALILVAICLSLVSGAEAGAKSLESGGPTLSGIPTGGGR